ncbi:MAG: hypothetical protein LBM95_07250 [Lactobacillales bacterium]|jgi:hypothetical protein|nr:hypothetical protein [Lactobacillales bacterium]
MSENLILFNWVLENFNEEKEFIKDGYYRVREVLDNVYDIDFTVSGPCGESILHPQIRVEKSDEGLVPIQEFDTFVTPVIFMKRDSKENEAKLDQAFTELLKKFQKAKN